MRKALLILGFLILNGFTWSQELYLGGTMGFTDYLEKRCGIVFNENGVPKDPFQSLADHGATIVRLRIDHPPYSSSYSEGEMVDHSSVENVKIGMQRAKDAGLKTLLTFGYTSWALEESQKLNPYVAPLAWQEIALELDKITDSVYTFTYGVLDEYCKEGLIPEIVSIGNESVWHILMPNVHEPELPPYDAARSAALHNAGSKAVRDISTKYGVRIKVCFHMMDPTKTRWWLEEHTPYGLDFDIIGISLYHGWNKDGYAGFGSLGAYVDFIVKKYQVEFLVMETAQLFRSGGIDNHVDILGIENIPAGYPNPPTTDTQKKYLTDMTREVIHNGGSGVITWGTEWVGCDCYIYADQWGKGSSWENKSYWDFNYNLHDGVNWMKSFGYKVPVTFKVDMTGVDVSNGVYVTGEFPNDLGEEWKLNSMTLESDNIYAYSTEMEIGASGAYYFLNDDDWGAREKVPVECIAYWGLDRGFEIPPGSDSMTFAYVWSSCEQISPVSVPDPAHSRLESLFEIIPNPVQNNRLNLYMQVNDHLFLTVMDLQGRILHLQDMDCSAGDILTIDLGTLTKGAYLVKLSFTGHLRNESKFFVITGK
ncbi:MAG: glycosyl hydrolase 53 family protein [Bacteroidales bacterium]